MSLEQDLKDAEKWACCGEPERRIRAEHERDRYRTALEEILGLYVCMTVDMSGISRKAPGAGGIAQRALGIKTRD